MHSADWRWTRLTKPRTADRSICMPGQGNKGWRCVNSSNAPASWPGTGCCALGGNDSFGAGDSRRTPPVRAELPHKTVSHPPQPAAEEVWRPAEAPRHNLPVRPPPLIGRDQTSRDPINRAAHRRQLGDAHRSGGVGKTQLSIQVALTLIDHFADGLFFIALASFREAEQVISTLAQTWNLPQQGDRPILESVQTYLRDKQMLLILDNFEHLMAAAPLVSELLATCAHLRILVTRRELLNLQGEQVYPVAPLSLPPPRTAPIDGGGGKGGGGAAFHAARPGDHPRFCAGRDKRC